jgi:hypothetical protein
MRFPVGTYQMGETGVGTGLQQVGQAPNPGLYARRDNTNFKSAPSMSNANSNQNGRVIN